MNLTRIKGDIHVSQVPEDSEPAATTATALSSCLFSAFLNSIKLSWRLLIAIDSRGKQEREQQTVANQFQLLQPKRYRCLQ